MGARVDAMACAAEVTLELERLATAAGRGTVGVVGEVEVEPGLINVVPGRARVSLDIRGTDDAAVRGVARDVVAFADGAAQRRGGQASYRERQSIPATPMSADLVRALDGAAMDAGAAYRRMPSGAAHDTMCVADRAPCAMIFVPCRDGISHAPEEEADPADGALACEVILNAVARLAAKAPS
jgi:acetylornithine deacetylase/succinyl-diaminopimelate desuccinylase-like protein